jgi:hypothetical protein
MLSRSCSTASHFYCREGRMVGCNDGKKCNRPASCIGSMAAAPWPGGGREGGRSFSIFDDARGQTAWADRRRRRCLTHISFSDGRPDDHDEYIQKCVCGAREHILMKTGSLSLSFQRILLPWHSWRKGSVRGARVFVLAI